MYEQENERISPDKIRRVHARCIQISVWRSSCLKPIKRKENNMALIYLFSFVAIASAIGIVCVLIALYRANKKGA